MSGKSQIGHVLVPNSAAGLGYETYHAESSSHDV